MRKFACTAFCFLLLSSCASLPTPDAPLLVQLPAWVSAQVRDPGLAVQLAEAWGHEVDQSGRYRWRTPGWLEGGFRQALEASGYGASALLTAEARLATAKALAVTHLGLLDVVSASGVAAPDKVVAYYRVVDASTGQVVLFDRSELATADLAAWTKRLLKRWRSETPVVPDPTLLPPDTKQWASGWASAPEDAVSRAWIAQMSAARAAADFAEMHRLADLLQDRANDGGQVATPWSRALRSVQAEISSQERSTMAEGIARQLVKDLAEPFGPNSAETLLEYRLLDRLRAPAGQEASRKPSVAVAFVGRFGEALATALASTAVLPVPGGSFRQGSGDANPDEAPVHPVTVSAFLLGRTEVTQEQYTAVMGANPSLFTQGPQAGLRPVERVTWFDAVAFCNKLSLREGLEPVYSVATVASGTTVSQDLRKSGYRLPTEAEWEWAARGAVTNGSALFSGSDDPAAVAWTDGRTASPAPVAQLVPNALGLYDLSGNVWEWCWDWYGKYSASAQVDPTGPEAGVLKVGRGGSWRATAWNARVTTRSYDGPASKGNILGFRVARSVPADAVSPPTKK